MTMKMTMLSMNDRENSYEEDEDDENKHLLMMRHSVNNPNQQQEGQFQLWKIEDDLHLPI